MKKISTLLVMLVFGVNCLVLKAQLTPWEAIEQMGRGINLGNTLEPETEGGWNNPAVEEYYFDDYVNAGFTNVRIPIRWDKHTGTTSPYTINADWMNRIEQIVDWALERKLFVVINAHHEEWLKNDITLTDLARFDSIWSQIAVRFKDKSDSLLFEMINEPYPMSKDTLDDLNERILSIIRKTNPTRIVVFSGNMWSNVWELTTARIPNDTMLIGYYHSYDPWPFAGEATGTWGTTSDINEVKAIFDKAKVWSDDNNIPVYLGEFGALESCDFNSRMLHYATYVEQSLLNGFAFSVWDNGGDFRVYQRQTHGWEVMKDILINYTPSSPASLKATNKNGDSVLVNWKNRTTTNDSIFIERGSTATSLSRIAALAADAEKYTDMQVEYNKTYYYRVVAHYNDSIDLMSYPQLAVTEHVSSTKSDKNKLPLQVFPVPADKLLNLRMTNEEKILSIKIISTEGRTMIQQTLNSEDVSLTIDNLISGTYILLVTTDKSTYNLKIEKL